jgi:PAS domain-containing protein
MKSVHTEPINAAAELKALVIGNEDWLIDRILVYAKDRGYSAYTSTLREAWRLSIHGLSTSLVEAIEHYGDVPELGPNDDYQQDPCAAFGILEARRHRTRGITLEMFLGLYQYYRQTYHDLLQDAEMDEDASQWSGLFIQRFFDRVELGFISEWNRHSEEERLEELQAANRKLTNEKNKYLTIFESLALPAALISPSGQIDTMNFAAAVLFGLSKTPGSDYYSGRENQALLDWIGPNLADFIESTPESSSLIKN